MDLPKDFAVAASDVPAPEAWWQVFRDPVLDLSLIHISEPTRPY